MRIKDRFALGTLAGVVATIPQIAFNAMMVWLNISKYYDFQVSAGIYLRSRYTLEPGGIFLGTATWLFMASNLGIIIAYIIRLTGRDFWLLKGVIISNAVMYTMVYGLLFSMGGPQIIPWDIGTNVSIFFENLIFGVTVSYLITRWGME